MGIHVVEGARHGMAQAGRTGHHVHAHGHHLRGAHMRTSWKRQLNFWSMAPLRAAASNPWQALAKALLTRSGVRQLSPLARDDQTYHDDGTVSAPSIVGSV